MNQPSMFDNASFAASSERFIADIESFRGLGQRTVVETQDDITYFVNEFWTSGQRRSHSIHEISYRACFKAQLPEFFIARLTKPGHVVHDPFMGRGTTPVQAALMQRQAFGNDVNPLSTLLARPRLRPIDLRAVQDGLQTIDWSKGEIERADLLAFYHPNTLRKLEALRRWLADRAPLGAETVDPVADWIRMVALNRLSGHSPGFFSGRSMPPNQAVTAKAQRKINARLGIEPPERDVAKLILKKTRALLKDGCPPSAVGASLHTGRAWSTPGIAASTVSLVVTSPPFLDVVQYAGDNWLRCWFAGIEPDSVAIDMHRTEDAWTTMVSRVLREQARILRPGGYVAFEVGEVRNGTVLLEKLVWRAAEALPFERLGVLLNDQEFTKTANCWGIANNKAGTNSNRVVLLKRTDEQGARAAA